MKVRKLREGAKIEVGDIVLHDSWIGKKWYKVVRVTEKFAVIKWSEKGEGKFQRAVKDGGGLRPCGSKDAWDTTRYSAWRPVRQESPAKESLIEAYKEGCGTDKAIEGEEESVS